MKTEIDIRYAAGIDNIIALNKEDNRYALYLQGNKPSVELFEKASEFLEKSIKEDKDIDKANIELIIDAKSLTPEIVEMIKKGFDSPLYSSVNTAGAIEEEIENNPYYLVAEHPRQTDTGFSPTFADSSLMQDTFDKDTVKDIETEIGGGFVLVGGSKEPFEGAEVPNAFAIMVSGEDLYGDVVLAKKVEIGDQVHYAPLKNEEVNRFMTMYGYEKSDWYSQNTWNEAKKEFMFQKNFQNELNLQKEGNKEPALYVTKNNDGLLSRAFITEFNDQSYYGYIKDIHSDGKAIIELHPSTEIGSPYPDPSRGRPFNLMIRNISDHLVVVNNKDTEKAFPRISSAFIDSIKEVEKMYERRLTKATQEAKKPADKDIPF